MINMWYTRIHPGACVASSDKQDSNYFRVFSDFQTASISDEHCIGDGIPYKRLLEHWRCYSSSNMAGDCTIAAGVVRWAVNMAHQLTSNSILVWHYCPPRSGLRYYNFK